MSAQFDILIPEHTFSTQMFPTRVCNISERGAMAIIDLDPEIGALLLHKTRYCRVCFSESELPPKVQGRAVWIEPQKGAPPGKERYRIGIFFENVTDDDQVKLQKFVAAALVRSKQRTP